MADRAANVPTSFDGAPLDSTPPPPFETPSVAEPLPQSSAVPTADAIQQIPASEAKRPSDVGELYVFGGNCNGQRIRVDFHRFVVGAERDCDLRPASTQLSRHHCVFKRDEYALRVRDLGSKNGTYVNGRRIYNEAVLKPGDEVTIGDITLHVVLPQSPSVTQSSADSNPSISDFVIL